jgi:protein-tyrosine kinase
MNASIHTNHLSSPQISNRPNDDHSYAVDQSDLFSVGSNTSKLGYYLLQNKKLQPDNIEQILARQSQYHLPFGTWAVNLSLCAHEDIEQALTAQSKARQLAIAQSDISKVVSCAFTNLGPYASAILELRHFLQLNWLGSDKRNVLAILSPQQRDGRSVLVANLAVTFAQMGLKTLIIDADLRKSTQTELFGVKSTGKGLSELCQGLCPIQESIVEVGAITNLYLMRSGMLMQNPHDIFARDGFAKVLSQCNASFQIVLVDTPSFAVGTEATLIARHAGSALLVARNGKTSVEAFESMSNKVKQNGINGVGAMLIG